MWFITESDGPHFQLYYISENTILCLSLIAWKLGNIVQHQAKEKKMCLINKYPPHLLILSLLKLDNFYGSIFIFLFSEIIYFFFFTFFVVVQVQLSPFLSSLTLSFVFSILSWAHSVNFYFRCIFLILGFTFYFFFMVSISLLRFSIFSLIVNIFFFKSLNIVIITAGLFQAIVY